MGILIDIGIVLFMALCIFIGYKRGLIKLAIRFCALILAIVLTVVLYKPVAGAIMANTELDENISEVIVWAFVSRDEKNNIYRVNIRSRGPVINEIASKYKGGGHKFASGVRNESKEDIDNLLKDLSLECKKYLEEKEKENGSN